MNRNLVRALVVAVVPVAALTLAACSGGHDMSNMPGIGGTTGNSMGGVHNDADTQFAQMMIVHHQQAVEMATLAETRAADPELKALAAQIKAAQGPEIATMTGWLAQWGQPTAMPGGHDMPGMGSMPGEMTEEEMTQLENASGVDFDRMFARMMIAHHNGAIQMATAIKTSGSSPDVKALADTIITTQTAEVATLQAILDRL